MDLPRCKRCNRILANKESIERGYGETCYRITNLCSMDKDLNEEVINLKNRINQISLRYTMLERKVEKMMKHGLLIKKQTEEHSEEIKRIKIEHEKPKTKEQINMMVVIKELKVIFNSGEPLKKDFRYTDEELGIKNNIETIRILKN